MKFAETGIPVSWNRLSPETRYHGRCTDGWSADVVADLRGYSQSYGDVPAVRGVSFEVREGEVFGLLGPNGAGKTTLMRILMDIVRANSGAITLFGRPFDVEALRRVGYLPEERGLYKTQRVLEVTIWFGMVLVAGVAGVAALGLAGVEIPWLSLSLCLPFFGAGYLFLGSLMLGTGSLGSNIKESQQFSIIWTLATLLPVAFLQVLLNDPHGTLGRVLTWIPFTSPLTVILRTAVDAPGIAWWEIAGAFTVLLVGTWFAIRLGARLFRIGLLLTGTRPKLREILRQARLP